MWRGGLREGEGEYRFSHGDRDGSGVIEDDECDCYRCGVRACTYTHTHLTVSLFSNKKRGCSPYCFCPSEPKKSFFFMQKLGVPLFFNVWHV